MYKRGVLLIYVFFAIAGVAMAPAVPQTFAVSTGTISFRSDAPLELIKAASDELKGIYNAEKKQFAFKIRIASFAGFNSPLQREHFNENYMESEKYPYATFEGKIIEDVDLAKDGTYSIRAKGNLAIHGVTQERIIKCDMIVKNSKTVVKSVFTVLLTDHNISIPKVVHEKLASEIKVEVKAELSPK
jgi:polyisoprenoid-binding protein YceI